MAIKRIGVVGSGIMGAGVAEVAAASGFEVVLRSRTQDGADAMLAGLDASLARQVKKGRIDDDDAAEVRGRVPRSPRSTSSPRATWCSSRSSRTSRRSRTSSGARPRVHAVGDPRDEHVDAAGRRDGDGHRSARARVRHPLLQPRAGHVAGRARARDHDQRRHPGRGARVRRDVRQDARSR